MNSPNLDNDFYSKEEINDVVAFSNKTMLWIAISLAFYTAIEIVSVGPRLNQAFLAISIALILGIKFIKLPNKPLRSALATLSLINICCFTIQCVYTGGIHSLALTWLLTVPLFTSTFLSLRTLIVSILATAISVSTLFFLEVRQIINVANFSGAYPAWLNSIQLLIGFINIFAIGWHYNSLRTKMKEKINSLNVDLTPEAHIISLGELAGGLAHEVNNPLTVINAHTSRIKKSLVEFNEDSQEIESELEKIKLNAKKITSIIKDMRKKDQDRSAFKLIKISEIFSELSDYVQIKLKGTSIKFNIEKGDLPEFIHGNKNQLLQVLVNLVNNSIYEVNKKEGIIRLSAFIEQKDVVLRIQDNGKGIPEHLKEKIFEINYSSKPIGEGSGIGLSLCRSIAQDHGGSLNLKNEEGLTTFELTIPEVS